MSDEEKNRVCNIKQVSRRLKVSTKQLRKWHKYGVLRAVRLQPMGPLKYTEESINNFIDGHTVNQEKEP